eukprot:365942-Chlamydomonas_euryale.AAC.64
MARLVLTKKRLDNTGHQYEIRLVGLTVLGMPVDMMCAVLVAATLTGAITGSVWWMPLGVLAILSLHQAVTTVTREKLTVLRGMGIFCESFMRCNVRQDLQFVDLDRIASVFLHEGITSNDIVYSLAFELTRGHSTCIAFKSLRPQLDLLKHIFREVHELLAEDKGFAHPQD